MAVSAIALIPSAAFAQAGSDKLDRLLAARAAQLDGRSRVIVEFRDQPDARVLTRSGGVAGRVLSTPHAQVADVHNQSLRDLARDPAVARVLPDRDTFATMERTGLAIGATMARQEFGLSGNGIGIAVIDSGVAAWHDDLSLTNPKAPRVSTRVVHFKDFTRDDNPRLWLSEQPSDDFGHGTHVAGIIAGTGFDSDGRRTGIAPRANIIALKVLDADGHGYISDVIDAIDYAIAVRRTFNIRVINLSVASGVFESYRTDPLAQAAKRAVDAGIVVVAAAGNLGEDAAGETQFGGITCPGNAPWVLTVGAASHQGTPRRGDDTVPGFTSRGPTWIDFAAKPDLLAYGVGIESLAAPHSELYEQYPEYLLDGTRRTSFKPYLSLSGTSMAAPVVAGTVALMLEANPDLTPNAVKALLEYTAEGRAGEHYLTQGAGLLNAHGAIRMARFFAKPRRVSPTPDDTIEGERIEWSRHIVWGNDRIGGGMLLPGSNAWNLGVNWATRRPGRGARSSGASTTTTTSSGATSIATTSCGARRTTTTSSGVPETQRTSSGARRTRTTSSGAPRTTRTSSGAPTAAATTAATCSGARASRAAASGGRRTTRTSSGARAMKTTSCGARRARTTTSSGVPGTRTTSCGARGAAARCSGPRPVNDNGGTHEDARHHHLAA